MMIDKMVVHLPSRMVKKWRKIADTLSRCIAMPCVTRSFVLVLVQYTHYHCDNFDTYYNIAKLTVTVSSIRRLYSQ